MIESKRNTRLVSAAQVDGHHVVPHLFSHIDKRLVPKNPGIGNQDIDSPESIGRGFDDLFAFLC